MSRVARAPVAARKLLARDLIILLELSRSPTGEAVPILMTSHKRKGKFRRSPSGDSLRLVEYKGKLSPSGVRCDW